jgi:hypothetical protein
MKNANGPNSVARTSFLRLGSVPRHFRFLFSDSDFTDRRRTTSQTNSKYLPKNYWGRRGCILHFPPARAILIKNKHLLESGQIPTHGFTVALSVFRGTLPAKPLDCKIRLKSSGAHLWRPPFVRVGGEPRLSRAVFWFLPDDIL